MVLNKYIFAMNSQLNLQRGFTLIEVTIAVAIVGMLAAVALPSYGDYTRKAMAVEGLSVAQPTLLDIREEVAFEAKTSCPIGVQCAFDIDVPDAVVVVTSTGKVKNIVRQGLNVIINYSRDFDPAGETEYSLVMSGKMNNNVVSWTCKSGPAAQRDLFFATTGGAVIGQPLPTKWAPSGCLG